MNNSTLHNYAISALAISTDSKPARRYPVYERAINNVTAQEARAAARAIVRRLNRHKRRAASINSKPARRNSAPAAGTGTCTRP